MTLQLPMTCSSLRRFYCITATWEDGTTGDGRLKLAGKLFQPVEKKKKSLVLLLWLADMTSARPLPWWTARLQHLLPRHKGGEEEEGWRCWRAAATSGEGKKLGHTHTHKTSGAALENWWQTCKRFRSIEKIPKWCKRFSVSVFVCVFKHSHYPTKDPHLDILRIVYSKLVLRPILTAALRQFGSFFSTADQHWETFSTCHRNGTGRYGSLGETVGGKQLGFQLANTQPMLVWNRCQRRCGEEKKKPQNLVVGPAPVTLPTLRDVLLK